MIDLDDWLAQRLDIPAEGLSTTEDGMFRVLRAMFERGWNFKVAKYRYLGSEFSAEFSRRGEHTNGLGFAWPGLGLTAPAAVAASAYSVLSERWKTCNGNRCGCQLCKDEEANHQEWLKRPGWEWYHRDRAAKAEEEARAK